MLLNMIHLPHNCTINADHLLSTHQNVVPSILYLIDKMFIDHFPSSLTLIKQTNATLLLSGNFTRIIQIGVQGQKLCKKIAILCLNHLHPGTFILVTMGNNVCKHEDSCFGVGESGCMACFC